jgi:CRISPR-associated endonuclease Csn1
VTVKIIPGLRFGIDLGIASCGWAAIRQDEREQEGEVLLMGSRCWPASETPKEGTSLNELRRTARGMRRVLRRRRQRMGAVRCLFHDAGLIASSDVDALKLPGLDPWTLRAEALDRALTGSELAVALGHVAKHRGFRSNSKRDRGANAADESSKMLAAIDASRDRLAGRTVGQMFAEDARYAHRKRNRDGNFDRSVLRVDQEREVRSIFSAQRRFGNALATEALHDAFAEAAFFQRPLQDSEDRVGPCLLIPGERRAALRAPSFERFRFLSRLAALRVARRDPERLCEAEIRAAAASFGETKTYTFKRLREAIGLSDALGFEGVPRAEEGRDVVSRTGGAAEGTASLRKAIVDRCGAATWGPLISRDIAKLDAVARVVTFRDDLGRIRLGLEEVGLDPAVALAVMDAVEEGRPFARFKGSGSLSARACRRLNPHLEKGRDYAQACGDEHLNHAERRRADLSEIKNPIARKSLGEAFKQVKALIEHCRKLPEFAEYPNGLPEFIHVELARDVGKSKEERDKIDSGIEKRNREKDRLNGRFAEKYKSPPRLGSDEALRYELWEEQQGHCLYTGDYIPPEHVIDPANGAEVDHILPWSRSGDDSFVNKTLCAAGTNREKRNDTPREWFERTGRDWDAYEARVERLHGMRGRKKRNFLLKDASKLEERFRSRNLNDTRYACRLLLDALKDLYPEDDVQPGPDGVMRPVPRARARPGPLTDRLRRAWGIQDLKKDEEGNRLREDRHHALDALVVAATTESALNRFTRAVQDAKAKGLDRDFTRFDLPWHGFVAEARAWMGDGEGGEPRILVSRAEGRRARGEAHGATIRAVEAVDGRDVVYERKAIDKLTEADLALVKDPGQNAELIATLRAWIAAGKPAKALPTRRYGGVNAAGETKEPERFEPIRKVTLRTKRKPDVMVRGGAADRGEMIRVDVFTKPNRRGVLEYFLVPVYPHQVFDKVRWPAPPDRAVVAGKPEAEWPRMDGTFAFLWSLYPMSYVAVDLGDRRHEGYFRTMDRSTGAITLSHHSSKSLLTRSIGARTAKGFRKFAVDRLGRRFEIERETRTWHGAACT